MTLASTHWPRAASTVQEALHIQVQEGQPGGWAFPMCGAVILESTMCVTWSCKEETNSHVELGTQSGLGLSSTSPRMPSDSLPQVVEILTGPKEPVTVQTVL